jgi:hypothetical protein
MRYRGFFGRPGGCSLRRGMLTAFLIGWSVFAFPAFAQSQSDPGQDPNQSSEKPSVPNNAVQVASVEVWNISVKDRKDNAFTLAFDVFNEEGVQPHVVYAVNLLRKNGEDSFVRVDQKVYDEDVLTLGPKERVHKEIAYAAPAYLGGTYTLEVEARNPDGLLLAKVAADEVTLAGNGEGVEVDPSTCFLTVDGEAGDKKYTLAYGVDVAQDETLVAHCAVKGRFQSARSVVPVFETRYRSAFGKVVGTEKQKALTLEPGQETAFTASLPKATDPQAYDAILTFVDDKGGKLSSPIAFHYVLRGDSATIQNFTLDKDVYRAGETANATLFWTGSADGFPGARAGAKEPEADRVAVVTIVDGQGAACADEFTKAVGRQETVSRLAIPVTDDCLDPSIRVRIADRAGKVLAENSYDIRSKSLSEDARASLSRGAAMKAASYAVALLAVILLLAYLFRRHKRTGLKMFFGLLVAAGALGAADGAQAKTFTISGYWNGHPATTTFTVSTNKDIVEPGGTITATGAFVNAVCSNGDSAGAEDVSLTAGTNGSGERNVKNTSKIYTVSTVSGWYNVNFHGIDPFLNQGWTSIKYYVSPPAKTPSTWSCGSANGKFYSNVGGDNPTQRNICALNGVDTLAGGYDDIGGADDGRNDWRYLRDAWGTAVGSWDSRGAHNAYGQFSGWEWYCGSSYCQAYVNPQPTPPACGSANGGTFSSTPTANLCSAGSANGMSLTGSWYSWNCQQANSTPVTCGAYYRPAPPPDPTLTFSASPTSVGEGGSSTLSWSTTNATSCTASDGWSDSKAVSGSESVTIDQSTNFTLTCVGPSGPGGAVSKTVTVGCNFVTTYPEQQPEDVCSDKQDVKRHRTCGYGDDWVYGTKNCNAGTNWREVAP